MTQGGREVYCGSQGLVDACGVPKFIRRSWRSASPQPGDVVLGEADCGVLQEPAQLAAPLLVNSDPLPLTLPACADRKALVEGWAADLARFGVAAVSE